VFEGEGVVEVYDGVDRAKGCAGFEQASVERFVRLGVFFGRDVAGSFECGAVEGDARMRLRIGVGGEGSESFVGCLLCDYWVRTFMSGVLGYTWIVVVAYLCEFGDLGMGTGIVKVIGCDDYDAHGRKAGCDFWVDGEAVHGGVELMFMEMWGLVDPLIDGSVDELEAYAATKRDLKKRGKVAGHYGWADPLVW